MLKKLFIILILFFGLLGVSNASADYTAMATQPLYQELYNNNSLNILLYKGNKPYIGISSNNNIICSIYESPSPPGFLFQTTFFADDCMLSNGLGIADIIGASTFIGQFSYNNNPPMIFRNITTTFNGTSKTPPGLLDLPREHNPSIDYTGYLYCNPGDTLQGTMCIEPTIQPTPYISWNGLGITIEQKSIDTMSDNVNYLTFSSFELMKFMPYIATLTITFFILAYIMSFARIKPQK